MVDSTKQNDDMRKEIKHKIKFEIYSMVIQVLLEDMQLPRQTLKTEGNFTYVDLELLETKFKVKLNISDIIFEISVNDVCYLSLRDYKEIRKLSRQIVYEQIGFAVMSQYES